MKIELDKTSLDIFDDALARAIDDIKYSSLEAVNTSPDEYLRLRHRVQDLLKHVDDQPWFTVVLIYPDYIANQYGEDYYIGSTQAEDAFAAVKNVQQRAVLANADHYGDDTLVQDGIDSVSDDFAMVTVFAGDLQAEL